VASTLLLDNAAWDLIVNAAGNIAVAGEPYSLSQDAASAIRMWLGEFWFDTTLGVPYLQQIFGQATPPLTLLKELLQNAALTVPDVASAQVFISSFNNRGIAGQVQVISVNGGPPSAAAFSVASPQGAG
jgi:hypothetical protein